MLHEFVTVNRQGIIARCKATAAARPLPPRTQAAIDHGVPMFLDQLVEQLRAGLSTHPEIVETAKQHGHDLLRQGFTVSEVVHNYGDICQATTEMALELSAPISTEDFRVLNLCLDDAIASAVTQYGRERQWSVDAESADGPERLAVMARDLRNSIYTASVALRVMQSGTVGISGSTGRVLDRNLSDAHDLVDHVLAQIEVYAARHLGDLIPS
jgi:hypothetical protein